jgi:hypothetical protein
LAQLENVAEEDEAIDAGKRCGEGAADLGTPRQIALGARAEM